MALLKSGEDPNSRDENGKTLFMWIAEELWPCVVLANLSEDVAGNAKSKDGYMVLMSAAEQDPAVLTVLLDDGAQVNAKDDKGRTALNIAQEKDYTQIVELFKAHGAKE